MVLNSSTPNATLGSPLYLRINIFNIIQHKLSELSNIK